MKIKNKSIAWYGSSSVCIHTHTHFACNYCHQTQNNHRIYSDIWRWGEVRLVRVFSFFFMFIIIAAAAVAIIIIITEIKTLSEKTNKNPLHVHFLLVSRKRQEIWQILEDWELACRWSKQYQIAKTTTKSVDVGVSGFPLRWLLLHGVLFLGSLSFFSLLPLLFSASSLSLLKRFHFSIRVSLTFTFFLWWGFFSSFVFDFDLEFLVDS